MRLFLIILSIFLSFPWQSFAQGASFNLMVFGDSLSAGYKLPPEDSFYGQLQNTLYNNGYDNVKVINASVSGDTTQRGLNRINNALAQKPHAVIIELGINDVLRSVPLKTTEDNLRKIIQTFLDNDTSVMLVGMKAPPFVSYEKQKAFSDMYSKLAKEYDLIFYPFFMKGIMESFNPYNNKYLLEDRAHPNTQGVQVIVENIFPTVEKFLQNQ